MSKKETKNYTRTGKGRTVFVMDSDNRIFKQMLLDLYDIGVFRSPDQLADELFSLGLHLKRKNLLNGENSES
jgi:hypothetical protein